MLKWLVRDIIISIRLDTDNSRIDKGSCLLDRNGDITDSEPYTVSPQQEATRPTSERGVILFGKD